AIFLVFVGAVVELAVGFAVFFVGGVVPAVEPEFDVAGGLELFDPLVVFFFGIGEGLGTGPFDVADEAVASLDASCFEELGHTQEVGEQGVVLLRDVVELEDDDWRLGAGGSSHGDSNWMKALHCRGPSAKEKTPDLMSQRLVVRAMVKGLFAGDLGLFRI